MGDDIISQTAADVFATAQRWSGRRVRMIDAIVRIAFESNTVFAYGNRGAVPLIAHRLGFPRFEDGTYRVDATGLFVAGTGKGGYGHLGGWDGEWLIEEIHSMRPAGASIAASLRAAILAHAPDALLSSVWPARWPPAKAANLVFYSSTTPSPTRFTLTFNGQLLEQAPCAVEAPLRRADAIGDAVEGLILLAIEAGFISETDLELVRQQYRPQLDDVLRAEHAEFACWLESGQR